MKKFRAGIFVTPQIRTPLNDGDFTNLMIYIEWEAQVFVKMPVGNYKAVGYSKIVAKMDKYFENINSNTVMMYI